MREWTDLFHYRPDPDGHGVFVELTDTDTHRPARGHISATQIAVINDELARRRHESGEE